MASKSNPWPPRTTLKCDEECLRLQRNARLANALNIDPQSHQDDHVPYSDTTLKFFQDNHKWAQTYEREFRVFAGDPTEKRLRFKPMQSHQRAFLHSLAEDFGLDTESSDPEPHRHVCVFKTPRFVSAPVKTLAQCVKIKAAAQSAASDATEEAPAPKLPYNAILLSTLRFGLTTEEIEQGLRGDYASQPTISIQAHFLPSEEVALVGSGAWTPQVLESSLTALKGAVAPTVRRLDLAKDITLCHVDVETSNVLRREERPRVSENGWSSVAGRSAARPRPAASASTNTMPLRSRFVALGKTSRRKEAEEQGDGS